jgi:hypothetical protein
MFSQPSHSQAKGVLKPQESEEIEVSIQTVR